MPSLSSLRPALKPFVPRSTTNAEMPFGAAAAIGRRHHDHHVGAGAVRDERLGAIQHPVVAVARRRRCACRRRRCRPPARSAPMRRASRLSPAASATVPSARRCRTSRCAPARGRCAPQPTAPPTGRRARAPRCRGSSRSRSSRRRHTPRGTGCPSGPARPAWDELGRKSLRLVPLANERTDFALGELANALAQELLLVGQSEVHVAARGVRRVIISLRIGPSRPGKDRSIRMRFARLIVPALVLRRPHRAACTRRSDRVRRCANLAQHATGARRLDRNGRADPRLRVRVCAGRRR